MYIGEIAKLKARITFVSERSMQVIVDVFAESLGSCIRHTNQAILWYVAFSFLELSEDGEFGCAPSILPPLVRTDEESSEYQEAKIMYYPSICMCARSFHTFPVKFQPFK